MTTLSTPGIRRLAGASATTPVVTALCGIAAVLMVVSGAIHLHLWRGPYRHLTVGHMNTLFLIQVIASFVLAAAVILTRRVLALLAGAALMAGTLVGFLISRYRTAGLFGFHLPYSTTDSKWALAVEIAATVLLLATAAKIVADERAAA